MERELDRFEADNPETRVVRLRPALIFKDEAATEIRRLFVGPFLPNFLLRLRFLPALPRIDRLRFQAVHSEDVGRAYLRAVLEDVDGAFNIAAEPPLSPEEMAGRIGVRSFPVPARVVRRLADLSWRLRLQPTPPGWLDMARNVPLMSSERAREELGWEPRHSAIDALEELVAGHARGSTAPRPRRLRPIAPASGSTTSRPASARGSGIATATSRSSSTWPTSTRSSCRRWRSFVLPRRSPATSACARRSNSTWSRPKTRSGACASA